MALALGALGQPEEAEELVLEEIGLAEQLGSRLLLGAAERTLGLVMGGDSGLDHLARSVRILAETEAQLELAHSLVEHGAALRRANRRVESRDPLRRGLDLAVRCGADPLASRAEEELRVSGAKPRRTVLSGPDSLTASERRIAELAAEGHSNSTIAQRLFVTRKTVEMHLSNSYRKLDIAGRGDLPDALSG
jgi:DNA-binding CsgD family transcriptional regulator